MIIVQFIGRINLRYRRIVSVRPFISACPLCEQREKRAHSAKFFRNISCPAEFCGAGRGQKIGYSLSIVVFASLHVVAVDAIKSCAEIIISDTDRLPLWRLTLHADYIATIKNARKIRTIHIQFTLNRMSSTICALVLSVATP